MAMPRSANAGGSSRNAMQFKAPRASPDARARAAAVISESIQIPTHLSLPVGPWWSIYLPHDQRREHRGPFGGDAPDYIRRAIMTTHAIVSREKWLETRRDLLAAEKDLTHRSDQVAELRRKLPWVRVDKPYVFEGPNGKVSLADLF